MASTGEAASGARFGFGCMLGALAALAVLVIGPIVLCGGGLAGVGSVGAGLDEQFEREQGK